MISSDITKCVGGRCPIKNKCHRFTAKDHQGQAYADFTCDLQDESCEWFMTNFFNQKEKMENDQK